MKYLGQTYACSCDLGKLNYFEILGIVKEWGMLQWMKYCIL